MYMQEIAFALVVILYYIILHWPKFLSENVY